MFEKIENKPKEVHGTMRPGTTMIVILIKDKPSTLQMTGDF